MKQVVYSIQGNIGSGKSVLLQLLSKRIPNILIAPEPLNQWQHIGKYNLLQAYYQDPKRWAYTFQNYALLTRSNHLHNLLKNQYSKDVHLFSERSIVADKQIFAKLLYKQQKMNEMEFQLYQRFYSDLQQLYKLPMIHHHIYLRTESKLCLQRIKKRGRNQQKSIELNYLESLHQMHEQWLGKDNCLVINGSLEFQSDSNRLKVIQDRINQWLVKSKLQQ